MMQFSQYFRRFSIVNILKRKKSTMIIFPRFVFILRSKETLARFACPPFDLRPHPSFPPTSPRDCMNIKLLSRGLNKLLNCRRLNVLLFQTPMKKHIYSSQSQTVSKLLWRWLGELTMVSTNRSGWKPTRAPRGVLLSLGSSWNSL